MPMSMTPARVLIVDDEPEICALVSRVLTREQFRCISATDSREAAGLLDRQPFDVLLSDVRMPGLSGLDLLTRVRRVRPDCRVVLMTGFAIQESISQALELGAYDLIPKPFVLSDLSQAVRRAVEDPSTDWFLPQKAARALQAEKELRHASLSGIRALVRAVEAKDPFTARHSEQVARYASEIAHQAGATRDQIESIRVASLLHDVGKIGVPDRVLVQAGALSPEDEALIHQHPVIGAGILQNLSLLQPEVGLVLHHHEDWDGGGYPDGLLGSDIPFGSRVIRIADALDAMLMLRSYRAALSPEIATRELQDGTSRRYDPRLTEIALEWIERNPERLVRPQ
jgi:cyclic di-GMP phosphodiesterase